MTITKVTEDSILTVLRTAHRGLTNREVSEVLGVNQASTFYWLKGLYRRGAIVADGGRPLRYAIDARHRTPRPKTGGLGR